MKSALKLAPVTVLLGLLFIVPLAVVLEQSLGGETRLDAYSWFITSAAMRAVAYRTMQMALAVTVLCAVIAYPAAVAIVRLSPKAQRVTIALIFLPSLASFLVRTYGWMAFLGSQGPLVSALRWLGLDVGSLVGTFTGLCIAMVHMLLPFQLLPIYTRLKGIPDNQGKAAMSLGVPASAAFLTIIFPQTVKSLLSGAILVFILCSGFFITPALIGGTQQTTLAQVIYTYMTQLLDWPKSSVVAVMLLIIVGAILFTFARLVSFGEAFGVKQKSTDNESATAKRHPMAMHWLRFWPRAATRTLYNPLPQLCLIVALATSVVPLFYVALISFQKLRVLKAPTISEMSLRWYGRVLSNPDWLHAAQISLTVAALSASISCVVAFLAAQELRRRPKLRAIFLPLILGPAIVPQIALAVGIYRLFDAANLIGTIVGLVLSHVLLGIPYAYITISNALMVYNSRLDEASFSLGASGSRTLFRIRLPMLAASLAGAAFFAFQVSMDEVVFASFLSSSDLRTLPMVMYAAASQDLSPELGAVGVLLICTVTLVGAIAMWLTKPRNAPLKSRSVPPVHA